MPSCFSWNLTGVHPFPLTLTWLSQLIRGTCSACLPWAPRLLLSEDPKGTRQSLPIVAVHLSCLELPFPPFLESPASSSPTAETFCPWEAQHLCLIWKKISEEAGIPVQGPGGQGCTGTTCLLAAGTSGWCARWGDSWGIFGHCHSCGFGNNFSFDTFFHKCGPIIETEPLFP